MLVKLAKSLTFFFFLCSLASSELLANVDNYFSQDIIDMANEYYKTPYPYKSQLHSVSRKIGNTNYTVQRPNHALLHAMRKASFSYFAIEALRGSKYYVANWIDFFSNPKSKSYNPNFEDQLAFAMLMLRTGRTSESNTRYKEDAYLSAEYFAKEAPKTGFFPNQKDIDDFVFAMQTIGDTSKCFDTNSKNESIYTQSRGCSYDRLYVYNWLYGIHHVDLRRMVGYNKDQILGTISNYLTVTDPINEEIKALWNYAGVLLQATGDTDLELKGSKWGVYGNDFFILSNNPVAARDLISKIHQSYIADIKKSKGTVTPPPLPPKPTPATPPPLPPKPDQEVPVIYATNDKSDPWFWYSVRPTQEQAEKNPLYSKEVLELLPNYKKLPPKDYLPWTFVAQEDADKKLQMLTKTVPDRWVDPVTGKRYVALYHGTTSDVLDIFKKGEKAVRFDVAANKVLGMGFYLAASLNEAKFYACARLKERKPKNPDLKALIAVFGVLEDDLIKGKYSPQAHLSDDTTGAPYDPEIFFKRNSKLQNQFNFFSNTAPYLKLSSLVVLPSKFETSNLRMNDDADGQPNRATVERAATLYTCPY